MTCKPPDPTRTSGATRVASEPAPAQHVRDRPTDDLEIGPKRPVGDVEVVDGHHLLQRDATGTEHLPMARHARHQLKATAMPTPDALVLVDDERRRAAV